MREIWLIRSTGKALVSVNSGRRHRQELLRIIGDADEAEFIAELRRDFDQPDDEYAIEICRADGEPVGHLWPSVASNWRETFDKIRWKATVRCRGVVARVERGKLAAFIHLAHRDMKRELAERSAPVVGAPTP